jgi:hypothetical protein
MHDWTPDDLELCADVAAATWVEERLRPWSRDRVLVWSYMPDVFEAYARVFHPPWRSVDGAKLRWADAAAKAGVSLDAETSFLEMFGVEPNTGDGGVDGPQEGSMPAHIMRVLAGVLEPKTSTPGRAWFCCWEGDGSFWSSAHGFLTTDGGGPSPAEIEAGKQKDERWKAAPKVRAPSRRYLLFTGPLSVVDALVRLGAPALNLWWPDDRAWFVSTEVDSISTYVGGSREIIDAVLGAPELEAVEARIDSPLDPRR